MRPPFVVCVVGKKKSGKTTTVVGLVRALVERGHRVMTVKHGHGFDLDREGSDSWKHRHLGGAARVVLAGPTEFAVVGDWGPQGEEPLEAIVARLVADADIVVAEGYKTTSYPKIEIFRRSVHSTSLYGAGFAGDETFLAVLTDDQDFRAAVPVLDADDPDRFRRLADLVERGRPDG